MPDHPPYPITPRWVKVQGIFVLGLVLLVVGMSTGLIHLEGGGHGPVGGATGVHTPPAGSH
jgi:hypothetical protein